MLFRSISPEDSEALRRAADEASGAAANNDGDSPMAEEQDDEAQEGEQVREKRKQTISYEKYIAMVNSFVQRVADDEAGSGEGVDGEALTQWYLEQKEDELQGEEDYHHELALAKMVLKKMVKVRIRRHTYYIVHITNALLPRTTFSWQSVAKAWLVTTMLQTVPPHRQTTLSMCCTPIVRLRSSKPLNVGHM